MEPKPSARVVELPIKVELISKHYKCFVITVILWKHIYWVGSQLLPIYTIAISWAYCKSPRCQRWDSNPLNTNLWHMARSSRHDLHSLTTTLRLAGEPNTSLVYSAYMATRLRFERRRSSSLHGSFQDYCLTVRLTGLIFSIVSREEYRATSLASKHLAGLARVEQKLQKLES